MDYSLRNQLKKPGNLDYASIEDLNENTDIIDAILAKANWDATVNPTVNDDGLSGYAIGSMWINQSTNKIFICIDATTGAAVWNESLIINSNNRVGIGVNNPSYTLHISGSFGLDGTITDVSESTIRIRRQYTTTTDASNAHTALYVSPYINVLNNVTNSGYFRGIFIEALRNKSGNAANGGTQGFMQGVAISYGHYDASVVTPQTNYAYGLYIYPYYKVGTITNLYDIYLELDQTGGTVTNRWGIYQANTANNRFNGYIGIGITPTVGLQLPNTATNGKIICYDLYAYNNVSALTFTDRTDAFLGDGIKAVKNIKADENGQIDHNTLPEFARSKYIEYLEEGKTIEKDGRDIGNMVSVLTTAMQQLIEMNEKMQKRINELETKLQSK